MSYSLQSLTHANDLRSLSAYFAVAASMRTALYTVKLVYSGCSSCLLGAGKDFAKTLKTILFTRLTYSICFQKMHLYISAGFVYQGVFFPSRIVLRAHEVISLQVAYPYNDCLGETTELWMLCLESESRSVLIVVSFLLENYWHLKCQFSVWTMYFCSSVLQTAGVLFQERVF